MKDISKTLATDGDTAVGRQLDALRRVQAAAPDLLAACERFAKGAECTCTDGGAGFVCDVCEGRAAIARARGCNQG